jgi:hypothetical protein
MLMGLQGSEGMACNKINNECQIPVASKIVKTFFCKNTKNNGIGMIKKKIKRRN